MKRFLFSIILLGLFSFVSYSQTTIAGDTLAGGATGIIKFKAISYCDHATFQAVNTKLSGTVAGKVYFLGSLDGTTWQKLDSLTMANVTTNAKLFTDNGCKYNNYGIQTVNSAGTMSLKTKALALYRKR
jgi:hypothetical protein